MNLSEIHINPSNPRIIKDERFKKLVKSIDEFPKMMALRPIIIDADGMILGGNMRFKALKELKYKDIPDEWVKRASELTDEEKQRFIIEDNVPFGEWDWDTLANEWDAEQLAEWGLEIPDFAVNKEVTEDDYEVPDEIKTDIVLGDLFEIGPHRLLCGDSTDRDSVAKLMNGQKADMVFTDPPYALFGNSTGVAGVTDENMVMPFFIQLFDAIKDNTKQFGHIYVCCDWHSAFAVQRAFKSVSLTAKNLCIWDKGDGGLGAMYQQCYEMIWFISNSPTSKKVIGKVGMAGEKTINGKPNIWRYPRSTKDRNHTAEKPVKMVGFSIANSSDENNLVIDIFLGGGTTMIAAHQLNRKCYGMEIDPKYCQVIVDRMKKLDPNIEIKKNGVLLT